LELAAGKHGAALGTSPHPGQPRPATAGPADHALQGLSLQPLSDSIHRWRSPANHGPPPPGRRTTRCKDSPAGRSTGPPNRAAPHRHGPKGKRYPTQSTAADPQPTPARHRRARRTTRCKDSPAGRPPGLRRVPVTLHRSCTPELGASCDVAVHSNIATRTAPDPLCRQETRIRHPGRTPPGSTSPNRSGHPHRRTPRKTG
jgi:hypothetical protein